MGWFQAGINTAFANSNGGEQVDWGNRDSVIVQVRRDGNKLAMASKKLRNKKDIVLAAVTQNGTALRFASDRRRADKGIVIPALEQNKDALQYVSPKLRDKIRFIDGKPVIFG